MKMTKRYVGAVLALAFLAVLPAPASAVGCWTPPITWAYQQKPSSAQFNAYLSTNENCLKTDINDDGTITRDYRLYTGFTDIGTLPGGTLSHLQTVLLNPG